MININPLEILWNYVCFKWDWKDLSKKEIALGFLKYPVVLGMFLFVFTYFASTYFLGWVLYAPRRRKMRRRFK